MIADKKLESKEPYIKLVIEYSEDPKITFEEFQDQLCDWIEMILDKYGNEANLTDMPKCKQKPTSKNQLNNGYINGFLYH